MEKPGRYHLHQVMKINIIDNKIYQYYQSFGMMHSLRRIQHYFCGTLFKNALPQSNHEKTLDKPKQNASKCNEPFV